MQGNSLHKTKTTMFVVLALALSVLSFHGPLDDFAHESVVKTTNESIALFAISRGINATVSLFQSAKLPFVGLSVGELLDPLNDAIERLSSVLVWAIGSLFLQRVALEVASSSISKWSFLVVGLIAITTSLLSTWQRFRHLFGGWERFRDLSVRLFIYLAVFRFIVPVFAIIGFLVSHLLFDTEINKNKEDLSRFSAGISVDISTPPPGTQEFEEEQALKASQLDELLKTHGVLMQQAEALDAQIQELSGEVGLRRYLPESLGGVSPEEQQPLKASGLPELDELLQTHRVLMQEAEALDAQIQELSGEVGLRHYLPESLGGLPADEQRALTLSGLPELDELLQTHRVLMQEAEALDTSGTQRKFRNSAVGSACAATCPKVSVVSLPMNSEPSRRPDCPNWMNSFKRMAS